MRTSRRDDGSVVIARDDGASSEVTPTRAPRVIIDRGVYARTRPSEARVALLARARQIADRVDVHAPIAVDKTHRGRLVYDAPRRLIRALGLTAKREPGDRGELHVLFDDEELVREAARAGLVFRARRGAWVELEAGEPALVESDSFAREVARVVGLVRGVEAQRMRQPPEAVVRAMRARGRRARERGPIGRARLKRAVSWVDALYPARGGANCFRRVLLEMALDRGAAEETLVFGFDVGRLGHVAFKDTEERSFDVAFEISP